mgnify:CR=1 FL=1
MRKNKIVIAFVIIILFSAILLAHTSSSFKNAFTEEQLKTMKNLKFLFYPKNNEQINTNTKIFNI